MEAIKDNLTEIFERILEAAGLTLLKVAVTAIVKYRQDKDEHDRERAKTIICIEVPPAIAKSGGEVEVHWVGAGRIQPADEDLGKAEDGKEGKA